MKPTVKHLLPFGNCLLDLSSQSSRVLASGFSQKICFCLAGCQTRCLVSICAGCNNDCVNLRIVYQLVHIGVAVRYAEFLLKRLDLARCGRKPLQPLREDCAAGWWRAFCPSYRCQRYRNESSPFVILLIRYLRFFLIYSRAILAYSSGFALCRVLLGLYDEPAS